MVTHTVVKSSGRLTLHRSIDRSRDRDRQRQRQTEKHRERQRQRDRETETERDRQRETDRETERDRDRERQREYQISLGELSILRYPFCKILKILPDFFFTKDVKPMSKVIFFMGFFSCSNIPLSRMYPAPYNNVVIT